LPQAKKHSPRNLSFCQVSSTLPQNFCYNGKQSFDFSPVFPMNCPRCNTELPNGAAFCSQCGNPMTGTPIFPPDPNEPQKTNTGIYLAIGCVGCSCLAGILLMVWIVGMYMLYLQHTKPTRIGFGDSEIAVGSDFNLYGKTLDDEDFDWESLRGKYVLVKFTATWCGPCKGEIPGMLDAYEKYHDKGLEIVSVYIWERGANAAATVRKTVEEEKLPWIIVSESLTEKSGQEPQGEFFGISGVPTMLLVDKEGKVLVAGNRARGAQLQQELKKLFEE